MVASLGGGEDAEALIMGSTTCSDFCGVNDITDLGLGGGLAILDESLEGGGVSGSEVVDGEAPAAVVVRGHDFL